MRSFLAVALVAACASVASASLTSQITFHSTYGSNNGGEFVVSFNNFGFNPSSISGGGFFETFCLERNENIEYGKTYWVDFSTAAKSGGVAGGNPDPLDPRTAYLYTEFQNGTLAGYNYGLGSQRTASANALQNVIWYIEEELTDFNIGLTTSEKALAAQFLAAANASGWTDLGGVRVMNVWANQDGTGNRQDQLVLIPSPAASLLGVIGLVIAGRMRRLG